jgi:hypothetical protein
MRTPSGLTNRRGLTNRQTVSEAMERTGTSCPSAALKKLKATNKRYAYLPHTGEKQRSKARLRMLAQLVDIPTAEGVRRGFTGLQMMQKPELAGFVKSNPEIFTAALNMDAVFVIEADQKESA